MTAMQLMQAAIDAWDANTMRQNQPALEKAIERMRIWLTEKKEETWSIVGSTIKADQEWYKQRQKSDGLTGDETAKLNISLPILVVDGREYVIMRKAHIEDTIRSYEDQLEKLDKGWLEE